MLQVTIKHFEWASVDFKLLGIISTHISASHQIQEYYKTNAKHESINGDRVEVIIGASLGTKYRQRISDGRQVDRGQVKKLSPKMRQVCAWHY